MNEEMNEQHLILLKANSLSAKWLWEHSWKKEIGDFIFKFLYLMRMALLWFMKRISISQRVSSKAASSKKQIFSNQIALAHCRKWASRLLFRIFVEYKALALYSSYSSHDSIRWIPIKFVKWDVRLKTSVRF